MPSAFGGGTGSGSIILTAPTPVTVAAAGFTTIATITSVNSGLVCFHFDVATQALDQFRIRGRAHDGAQLITYGVPGNSWTDRSAPNSNIALGSRILEANANLDTIAAAGNGYFSMDISGLVEILVEASAAVDGAVVTVRYSRS